MEPIDWQRMWVPEISLAEVAFRAAVVYAAVQVFLRLLGRKELGRYSAYDVALLFLLGTALRMTIVVDDPSLTAALVALAVIVALEFALSWLSSRSPRFWRAVAGPPRLLIHDGVLQERTMKRVRISREQLESEVRLHGRERLGEVKDARLEPSGKLSFVFRREED